MLIRRFLQKVEEKALKKEEYARLPKYMLIKIRWVHDKTGEIIIPILPIGIDKLVDLKTNKEIETNGKSYREAIAVEYNIDATNLVEKSTMEIIMQHNQVSGGVFDELQFDFIEAGEKYYSTIREFALKYNVNIQDLQPLINRIKKDLQKEHKKANKNLLS